MYASNVNEEANSQAVKHSTLRFSMFENWHTVSLDKRQSFSRCLSGLCLCFDLEEWPVQAQESLGSGGASSWAHASQSEYAVRVGAYGRAG